MDDLTAFLAARLDEDEETARATCGDYKSIAERAVGLLCSIGCYGLDPSKQRQLWQEALDLDRKLHPSLPPVTVWTKEEGDIDPPRRAADGTSMSHGDLTVSVPPQVTGSSDGTSSTHENCAGGTAG